MCHPLPHNIYTKKKGSSHEEPFFNIPQIVMATYWAQPF